MNNQTLTVILAAGTTSCRIAIRALRSIRAQGGDAVAVLAGCEPAGELGITSDDGAVHYEQIPSDAALIKAVTDRMDQHPWLTLASIRKLRERGASSGFGQGAAPGTGRSAFTLVSPAIFDQLSEIGREARKYSRKVEVVMIVNTPGGTSRGSLMEIGMVAKSALPMASRRMLLVLPYLGSGVFTHERRVRAQNALTALALTEDGMVKKRRQFHHKFGLCTSEPERIADEVLLVVPTYQIDSRASVQELGSLDEIEIAVARQVEGFAGGAMPYRMLADRTFDQTDVRWQDVGAAMRPRVRWLNAVGEARIWLDDARLRAEVENAVLEGLTAEAT